MKFRVFRKNLEPAPPISHKRVGTHSGSTTNARSIFFRFILEKMDHNLNKIQSSSTSPTIHTKNLLGFFTGYFVYRCLYFKYTESFKGSTKKKTFCGIIF